MRIFVRDGARHTRNGGYGIVARNFIVQLVKKGHQVHIDNPGGKFKLEEVEEKHKKLLESLTPAKSDRDNYDIVFQIKPPNSINPLVPGSKNIIFTLHGLSHLPSDWIEKLQGQDKIMVGSRYDQEVFARGGFEGVEVVPLASDGEAFCPLFPKQKNKDFTFYAVGTFHFRKGWDLLLEAYYRAFTKEDNVLLRFKVNESVAKGNFKSLGNQKFLREFQEVLIKKYHLNRETLPRIEFDTRELSMKDMNKEYNKADAFILLSRGEGWQLPAMEALLCQLPVIVPAHTAISEWARDDLCFIIDNEEVPVKEALADNSRPFGFAWAKRYSEGDIETRMYVSDVEQASKIMGIVKRSWNILAKEVGWRGREYILENYNWDKVGDNLERIIQNL